MRYDKSEFLIQTIVPEDEIIISRTDLNGIITYANETFAQISGYQVEELIGKSHNILRHPDMPKILFEHMWKTLKSGKMWQGYVKNMRKDGGYYWVNATAFPPRNSDGTIRYVSVRVKPTKEEIEIAKKLYEIG